MATAPGLLLRQTQNLLVTPQLQLAIRLLQMTSNELGAMVEEELQSNPYLTRASDTSPVIGEEITPPESGKAAPSSTEPQLDIQPLEEASGAGFDDTYTEEGSPQDWRTHHHARTASPEETAPSTEPSLYERLEEQLRLTRHFTPTQRLIGHTLIENLDLTGWLGCTPADISQQLGLPIEEVEAVRHVMMTFEPAGLFSCSLRECLSAQLSAQGRLTREMGIVLDNLDMVGRRNYAALRSLCRVDETTFGALLTELRRLDPKPGFDDTALAAITRVPDVIVQRAPDGEWVVRLNEETLPRLQIDQGLRQKTRRLSDSDDRAFIRNQISHASWLIRAMEQRSQTLLRVTSEIMKYQKGFLDSGAAALKPLTMRVIADATGMHESTISRITSGKYVATPWGLHELKYFFITSIGSTYGHENTSSEAVRYKIRKIISAERPDAILSDDDIVRTLRKEGIDIARRTVAKYRDALHIANSMQRKREKAASV